MSDGLSYACIAPLLQGSERREGRLCCRFRCPATGISARGAAPIGRGAAAAAPASEPEGLWTALRRWTSDLLVQEQQSPTVSGQEVEAAVVAAFREVMDRFQWDGARWQGAAQARLGAAFERRLEEAPVLEERDRALLALILAQVAGADRQVKPEEQALLQRLVGDAYGPVDVLARRGPPRAADVHGVARDVRETMLALGWAVALCDHELALGELSRLNELAEALEVPAEQAEALRREAQDWLLERALTRAYPGGARDAEAYAEAQQLAVGMGLSAEDLERAEAEVRGRRGS